MEQEVLAATTWPDASVAIVVTLCLTVIVSVKKLGD
jgi:hypothetical protein